MFNRPIQKFRSLEFPHITLPLAIMLLLAATFGWYVSRLGFYWDDWAFILTAKVQGLSEFWQYHQYDRPVSAWINIVQFPLVGTSPLGWQVFVLALRGLTAFLVGWSIRLIWPQHTREAWWTALLFVVYPVFNQQPIAVTYTQHWTCYILYLLSISSMVLAYREPRKFWVFNGIALAALALNLFSMEYFAGMEILRPVILWFVISGTDKLSLKRSAWRVLSLWWPYLVVLGAFIIWRVFILNLPSEDPNQLRLVYDFFAAPRATIKILERFAWQDTLYILFTGWKLSDPINLRNLLFAAGTALLAVIYLSRLKVEDGEEQPVPISWAIQAILLASLSIIFGPAPAWLTGKQVAVGLYSSRFALPALFGGSLMIVALLTVLPSKLAIKLTLLGALITLAILYHYDNSVRYITSWEQQRNFYWQLYWRAPSIQSNTPVLSDGEVLNLVGYYSTTAGLNLLYGKGSDPTNLDYWFFNMEKKTPPSQKALESGRSFTSDFRNWRFSGAIKDSLVIDNGTSRCLWVVGNDRPENIFLSPKLGDLAFISHLDRIQLDQDTVRPPVEIFGNEPAHTWCYFYQKAELARQFGKWDEISRLGDEARALGFTSIQPLEWFPFIEGYAMNGSLDQAEVITRDLHAADSSYDHALCALWKDISFLGSGDGELQQRVVKIRELLTCEVE